MSIGASDVNPLLGAPFTLEGNYGPLMAFLWQYPFFSVIKTLNQPSSENDLCEFRS